MIHIYRISKHLGGREISDQESLIQKLKAVENSSSNIVIHKETCFNVELLQGMYSIQTVNVRCVCMSNYSMQVKL